MTDINLKNITKILDSFKKDKAKLEDSIAKIDEKYRRLAEEKKKELVAELAKCSAEVEFWEKNVLPRYSECSSISVDDTQDEPVDDEEVVVAEKKSEDEKVEDVDEEEIVIDEDEVPAMKGIPVEDVNVLEKMETVEDEPFVETTDVEAQEQASPVVESVETEKSASSVLDDFWSDTKDNW